MMGSFIGLPTRLQSQLSCAWFFITVPMYTVFIVMVCPIEIELSLSNHFQSKSGILSGFSLSLLLQPRFSYSGNCAMYFLAGRINFTLFTHSIHICPPSTGLNST